MLLSRQNSSEGNDTGLVITSTVLTPPPAEDAPTEAAPVPAPQPVDLPALSASEASSERAHADAPASAAGAEPKESAHPEAPSEVSLPANAPGASPPAPTTAERVPDGPEHAGVRCHECGQEPIRGVRFKCAVCPAYDLCSVCVEAAAHPADHPLIRLAVTLPGTPSAAAVPSWRARAVLTARAPPLRAHE